MKWRYSRRTMSVRCILVETTVPVSIRPRIETLPVKGHFLSIQCQHYIELVVKHSSEEQRTNVCSLDGCLWCLKAQTDVLVPEYVSDSALLH